MEKTLSLTLNRLGIRHGTEGRTFMEEAVKMRVKEPFGKVTVIYHTVGKEFGFNWNCVERAIRQSIKMCGKTCDKEFFTEIIGYFNEKVKPTNAEFISAVADYLRKLGL